MFQTEITHDVQHFVILPKRQIHFLSKRSIAIIGFAVVDSIAFHVAPIDPVNYILRVTAIGRILIYIGFQNIGYLFRSNTSYSSFFFHSRNRFTANTAPWQNMKDIPIWEKSNLTLEEAAAYSGIGMGKLRKITNEKNCNFVLWVGNKRLIKKKLFDKYIEQVYSI